MSSVRTKNMRKISERADAIAAFASDISTYFPMIAGRFGRKQQGTDRSKEIFRLKRNPRTYEVVVKSDIELDDYKSVALEEDWETMLRWAAPLKDKTVVFINPTMEGGGVAILRPPLVHMFRLLGVNAHWYVMGGRKNSKDANPFMFTKLMHNIIQRRTAPNIRITDQGKKVHQLWNAENAAILKKQRHIKKADVIVIDDPQPAPLIPYLKKINPAAKLVWRDHIDNSGVLMDDPKTPQGEIWQYLRDECRVGEADAFVFHPVKAFVPPSIMARTFFAPATIEPYDDLNRALTEEEVTEGFKFINQEIEARNRELADEGRIIDEQSPLDPKRRRITLIARFDESKGMDKAMLLGARVRQKMLDAGVPHAKIPQIVIIGNGSVDDPSGIPMYEKMLRLRREEFKDAMKDIIIMRLKHNYAAVNALMYTSDIGLQTSEAEGCENRITDWIRHDIPVVIASRGGMPMQVIEGKSGYILDFDKPDYDIERGAKIISGLLTDSKKYADLRKSTQKAAIEYSNREFTTTANVTRWLRVCTSVLAGSKADGRWKMSELVNTTPEHSA
jgi:glycosyltransferase involved in cell wall biosynthesis